MTKQKIFGISGWKNSGKTTLTASLIKELSGRGHKISSVKHAHHHFDVDQPGTDSYKHRQSGAGEVMLASSKRYVLMHDIAPDEDEPDLDELVAKMAQVDLILVEGFKSSNIPKIQAIRQQSISNAGKTKMQNIVAYASDGAVEADLPVYDINDIKGMADFVLEFVDL